MHLQMYLALYEHTSVDLTLLINGPMTNYEWKIFSIVPMNLFKAMVGLMNMVDSEGHISF